MAETIQIYFSGAIRGGREDQALYRSLVTLLKQFGDVLTEHIADAGLAATGEKDLPDQEIFGRDMKWLRSADVLVAEVSTPSLGVGYEIAQMEQLERPILCLYRELPGHRLSAMIAGNPALVTRKYSKPDDLRAILADFISSRLASESNSM